MNEEAGKTNKPAAPKGDFHTFLIAFLTSVIVLTLYHIGCEVKNMFCGDCGNQKVVLVRLISDEGPQGFHHPGKKAMMRRGKGMMGPGCPMMGEPGCPMDNPGCPMKEKAGKGGKHMRGNPGPGPAPVMKPGSGPAPAPAPAPAK